MEEGERSRVYRRRELYLFVNKNTNTNTNTNTKRKMGAGDPMYTGGGCSTTLSTAYGLLQAYIHTSHTNIFTYTNNIFIHTQITYSFIRKYTNDVSLILQHILTYTHKYTSAFSIDQLATFVLQKIFCIFFLGEIELSQIKFT